MDRDKILQNILIGFVVLLVGLSLWFGVKSGQALAQSKLILINAGAVTAGLDFFYNDYGRFPSLLEYETPDLMSVYFSKWPPIEFSGKLCSRSFSYESSRFNEYSVNMCLPTAKDGFLKGINQFTVTK